MHFYSVYNLTFGSELILPELTPLEVSTGVGPDVIIRLGGVCDSGLAGGEQLGPFLWVDPASLWLRVPHVARFLVTDGREITVDPEPGIDEDSIRVFLLGSAFGALLFQRGLLVLHGNAIRIGDQCMVCAGHSGVGKSTLAAGFMQRGHQILADDVVPVDSRCYALPGFPRIKLWQDVADKLGIDTANLRRIRPNLEKYNYPVGNMSAGEGLPIRWIYILKTAHTGEMALQPVNGMHRFHPLHDNTYRVRFLHGMALKPQHLKLCGRLASSIRLADITRPRTGFNLDQMIDVILADIDRNP